MVNCCAASGLSGEGEVGHTIWLGEPAGAEQGQHDAGPGTCHAASGQVEGEERVSESGAADRNVPSSSIQTKGGHGVRDDAAGVGWGGAGGAVRAGESVTTTPVRCVVKGGGTLGDRRSLRGVVMAAGVRRRLRARRASVPPGRCQGVRSGTRGQVDVSSDCWPVAAGAGRWPQREAVARAYSPAGHTAAGAGGRGMRRFGCDTCECSVHGTGSFWERGAPEHRNRPALPDLSIR